MKKLFSGNSFLVTSFLVILSSIVFVALLFNLFIQFGVASQLSEQAARISLVESKIISKQQEIFFSSEEVNSFLNSIIPTGVPEIYGEELGVSFDDPVSALDILKRFDPTYGSNRINMQGELLQRYINVGSQISCEYCCSVTTLVFGDGSAACGCAHSQAMRGLAAFLLENHFDEYTDDEILVELTKWKTMYFPKQTIQKAIRLAQERGDTSFDPRLFNEIPEMVGGC